MAVLAPSSYRFLIRILSEQVKSSVDGWLFDGLHQAKVTEEWKRTATSAGVTGFTPHHTVSASLRQRPNRGRRRRRAGPEGNGAQ